MIKIITGTEARTIEQALKDAYKILQDFSVDDSDLEDLKYALEILRGLKEKALEEILT